MSCSRIKLLLFSAAIGLPILATAQAPASAPITQAQFDTLQKAVRDAQSSGDPVAAENYYQHAEHYFRLIAAAQAAPRSARIPSS